MRAPARHELAAYQPPPPEAAAQQAEQTSAAGAAVAYIKGRWAAFVALERSLLDLAHRSAVVSAEAERRGDLVDHELARQSVARIVGLRSLHDRALRTFDGMRDAIPSFQGLGALAVVPLALVGTVLALAAMVTFIFARVGAEERIVRLLEAGQLTPEEAARLLENADAPSAGEGFASTLKWVLGGVVVLAALRTLRELR